MPAGPGFFIPYRHADAARPRVNPVVDRLFRGLSGQFGEFLRMLEGFSADLSRIRDDEAAPAPRWGQDWFPRLDAAAAYAMVRLHRPRRIVEVGSGHSTRFLARAVTDGALDTEIVAVDPAPRAALPPSVRHVPRLMQEVADLAAELVSGDVLFIDSSHVLMPGTDVDLLFGEILPVVPGGALVHIHDVTLPDPYPEEWAWRGYNEQGVVAALLGTGAYEALFASHFAATRLNDLVERSIAGGLPLLPGAKETSLWLRKRTGL
jgi:hypothetical protein